MIRTELRRAGGAAARAPRGGGTPGLGTVLVGDDRAERRLRGAKHKACAEVGIASIHCTCPADASAGRRARRHRAAQRTIPRSTATSSSCPSPTGLDDAALLAHRPRQGRRRPPPGEPRPPGARRPTGPCRARRPASRSCSSTTASTIAGPHVVVVGRGPTLGRPLAILLSAQGARGQRRRDRRPHRRRGPRRASPARPTSWSPPPGAPASSPPTWSSRGPSSSARASRSEGRRCCPTSPTRCARSRRG